MLYKAKLCNIISGFIYLILNLCMECMLVCTGARKKRQKLFLSGLLLVIFIRASHITNMSFFFVFICVLPVTLIS